jgi:DNA-binding NarL/FixJ family response regulator
VTLRVLIVDDDRRFRAAARLLLSAAGYAVAGEAGSLEEARRLVGERAPHALLLDVALPDGDGVELARALSTQACALRILLTSTDPSAVPAEAVRSCGARGFVAKDRLAVTDLRTYLG